ncbi:MAG: hypothetical protein ACLR17_11715 [Enterobacteriaceae bacterium]
MAATYPFSFELNQRKEEKQDGEAMLWWLESQIFPADRSFVARDSLQVLQSTRRVMSLLLISLVTKLCKKVALPIVLCRDNDNG